VGWSANNQPQLELHELQNQLTKFLSNLGDMKLAQTDHLYDSTYFRIDCSSGRNGTRWNLQLQDNFNKTPAAGHAQVGGKAASAIFAQVYTDKTTLKVKGSCLGKALNESIDLVQKKFKEGVPVHRLGVEPKFGEVAYEEANI